MRRTSTLWIGMATAAAVVIGAAAAYAQDQPSPTPSAGASDQTQPKPKAKPKAQKPAANQKAAKAKKLPFVAVTVTNNRSVSLVELTATFSGKTGDTVSVAKDLPGGKKTVAHLAHEKDCLFDLHGVFDDGATSDAIGVNLCKDKAINLNE